MGKTLDFQSQHGIEKNAWLHTRQEKERYNRMVARFAKDNPNATLYQELIGQQIIELRIMLQRLMDRRAFFFGEPTTLTRVDEHTRALDSEDANRKQTEWNAYYMGIQKELRAWLQLAVANSVSVELSGDLSSMFAAMDATDRQRLARFKGNGKEKTGSE